MKRMKTKTGNAEVTSTSTDSDRASRRKTISSSSSASVSNGKPGRAVAAAVIPEKEVSIISSKRKSCPPERASSGVMALVDEFLQPDYVAKVFERDDGQSSDEIKMKRLAVRRIVQSLDRLSKTPSPSSLYSSRTGVFAKIMDVIKANAETIQEENWSVVLMTLRVALSPSNCGSNFTNLEGLITEIMVHKPSYSNAVLTELILKLVRPPGPMGTATSFDDDGPSIKELKCFDVAVKLICKVVQVVGMKRLNRSLLNMLTNSYPYILKPALTHFYYIRNLLSINKTVGSSMTYCVLSVIFHKLTQLDAFLPRDLLESDNLQNIVLPKQEKSRSNPGGSFIIPEEDSEELVTEILKSYGKVASQVDQAQQIATMDISLSYLISFLDSAHENLNFNSLLSIFEADILSTFNTNCVQFAFFYLINLKEEYMNAFMEALWKKFLTVSTPLVLRIQAAGYIAGVLARSMKADRRTLKRWISRLSTFAHEYLTNRSSSTKAHWSNVNIHAHGAFYAACQAIFLTFAFRHFEIVYGNIPLLKEEGDKKLKPSVHSLPPPSSTSFIYTLNLQRLITCDLNPLKACCPSVAKIFVQAAHAYQISYCKTVLERNNRATIRNMVYEKMQDVSNNTEASGVNLLNESFFPFNSLPLAYAKQLVEENFRVFDDQCIALSLVGEAAAPSASKSRRRGESESQDICEDFELDDDDVTDGQNMLLVCE